MTVELRLSFVYVRISITDIILRNCGIKSFGVFVEYWSRADFLSSELAEFDQPGRAGSNRTLVALARLK